MPLKKVHPLVFKPLGKNEVHNDKNMVYITVRKSLSTSDQSEIQADHDQRVIF